MMSEQPAIWYHEDLQRFREAVGFTASARGFSARLVEKDYYCSVVLAGLAPLYESGLTLKGGSSLSKVHTDFYRLSEDLDFVFHTELGSRRSARRQMIEPVKEHMAALPERLPFLSVPAPLRAHALSTQYIATVFYRSCLSNEDERITVEIGLREPVLQPAERRLARTMLLDPLRGEPAVQPVEVRGLSLAETYAEKVRAALSRRTPAIRDFFDLDYAVRFGVLAVDDLTLIDLAARKLRVSGGDSIDVSQERLAALRQQLAARLRPVLRQSDFNAFNLDRAFKFVCDLHRRLQAYEGR